MSALQGIKDQGYDAVTAGNTQAAALNEIAPSLLLNNDIHHMTQPSDGRPVHADASGARGWHPARACSSCSAATRPRPRGRDQGVDRALASRINRTFLLPTIGNDEAALLLAKKLLAKRVVEDLDPIYPFDRESIALINARARGNPPLLLETADQAISYPVEHPNASASTPRLFGGPWRIVPNPLGPCLGSHPRPRPRPGGGRLEPRRWFNRLQSVSRSETLRAVSSVPEPVDSVRRGAQVV